MNQNHPERAPNIMMYVIAVVVAVFLAFTAIQQWLQSERIGEINQRQRTAQRRENAQIQEQNDIQICAQFNITSALKTLGFAVNKNLGLPVEDIEAIPLPDIEGMDCETPQDTDVTVAIRRLARSIDGSPGRSKLYTDGDQQSGRDSWG